MQAVEWKDQFMALSEAKVKSILPEEAMRMVTAGEAVLVDVRKAEDYNTSHALDAVSVPLFQAVNPLKTDMKGMLKFAVYAINGVGAVEPNLNFEDEVAALVGDKAVIMYCEAGGMLEPTPNFMYGRESRSLKACYKVSWQKGDGGGKGGQGLVEGADGRASGLPDLTPGWVRCRR